MAKKITSKALAGAIGATFITSLAALPAANAAENPFAAKPLTSGYQVADAGKEGKCGGMKGQEKEAHCGGKTGKDAHCGGKADEKKKGKKDGSCGEAKCGGKK